MQQLSALTKLVVLFALLFQFGCQTNTSTQNRKYLEKLIGVDLEYQYSGGNAYHVKLEEEGLSYRFVSGPKPERWWGPFPYNHTTTEHGEQLVSWFEKGYGDYVTLLVNFDLEILYGSAIIKGEIVHFEKARIKSFHIPE
jgi:phenolic acid decarboxylase